MEQSEITEEGDERPGFLRVPAPETAPRIIGPDAAENRARGEQENADLHRAIDEEMHQRRQHVNADQDQQRPFELLVPMVDRPQGVRICR